MLKSSVEVRAGVIIVGGVALVATVVVLITLLASHVPQFDRSDIVGVYVAKYPSGTQTLTLNTDGTFLQEVVLSEPLDSTPITRMGEWNWDESQQILRLPNCMVVGDGRGDIRPTFRTDSGCSLPPGHKWLYFGQLLLGDRDTAPL